MRYCEDPDATVRDVALVRGLIFLSCMGAVTTFYHGVESILRARTQSSVVLLTAVLLVAVMLIFCKYCVRSVRRSSMNTPLVILATYAPRFCLNLPSPTPPPQAHQCAGEWMLYPAVRHVVPW